jgi:mannosyltransferase
VPPPSSAKVSAPGWNRIEAIAPNFKRRLSGVTTTIVRIVPVQAAMIGIAATGPGLPASVPHVPLWRVALAPRDRWRVWHARRNTEMLGGIVLTRLLRRRFRLVFTSASQRRHSGYTKWLIRRMDAVIATSRKTAGYLERPAEVILHGIDSAGFAPAPDRAALRRRLGLPEAAVIAGCFGRIREQKGTGDFVEAMLPLLAENPRLVAIVMGRATEAHTGYRDRLLSRVAEAGMADRLRFLPEVPVTDMAAWYAALDLFVAPQRWEGFGLTPLEAMACAVPVVATRVGAFEELVIDGETGTLVPPGEPAALSAAVATLIADPERLGQMGRAARAHVEAHHRIEDEARAIVVVYQGVLNGGGRAAR